ncbi:hypothetical protein LTS08_007167 [Lithohypha guttulata]|nr:hypothetical protein LTS08_007167 [Lithohypha guttulata]
MSELAKYNPALVPKPYACGQFKESHVPTYFFLMEFLDIQTGAPDPIPFCEQMATLHKESVSPTGKFGFRMTTCHGPHPQNTTWEADWSVYFGRLLRQFFDREIATNGHDAEYEALFSKLEDVIPRLLGPLQAKGRQLKPCLVHGDLWEENTGTALGEGGQPKIFDAAVMYAHNEYDIAMWRRDICRFGRTHSREYLRHMPPSEPKAQWDDRNRLYAIKFEIAHAIGWPQTAPHQRALVSKDAKCLIDKYGALGSLDVNGTS